MDISEQLFGNTRTNVETTHALITPDSHVPTSLINWKGCIIPYILISPPMSKSFQQIFAKIDLTLEKDGEVSFGDSSQNPDEKITQRFIFIHTGVLELDLTNHPNQNKKLSKNDYVYLPPNEPAKIYTNDPKCTFTIFEKKYEKLSGYKTPDITINNIDNIQAEPFLGYKRAMLKTLLPISLEFDMAVNLFTYETGATLPLVENHIMEHGMLITEGQGVYRLDKSYYPVCAGDVLWIAAYCPQWYVSMGDIPSSYLYYKDVNRTGLK